MSISTRTEKQATADMVQADETIGYDAFADDAVHWWKQPGLRRLYLLMPFLFLGSTTLGYDGSLLNGLQAMDSWESCNPPPPHQISTDNC